MTNLGSVQREPLNELLRRTHGPVDDHPGPEEIVRYRAGDLPGEEADRLQEHFVQCPDCRELLLLRSSADESGVVDFGVVPAWGAMRRRMRWDRWQVPLMVAAASVLLVLGLSTQWNLHLKSMVAQLSQPQVAVVHELISLEELLDNRTRGGGDPRHEIEVPPGVDSMTFMLHVDPVKVFDKAERYPVEIVDSAGRVVWSIDAVTIDRLSAANLAVPRAFLDSGDYNVLIYEAHEETSRQLIDTYPVTLSFSAETPAVLR